ncbi:hypothetical protein GCM10007416_29600 [Kroppenstedtia guangzhouensis]|uniref:Uncharacterized protein n=1 Tax=Kroppenstedtia guangzhouensis TaxID=1274356 RepID=A0ABQ1H0F3_9BACL|nr:hypothetical protein GCM10007416_29600 [Kroppenstedtia guangzhouensis]
MAEGVIHHFYGNMTAQSRVHRLVDDSHSATAHMLKDLISAAQPLSFHLHHLSLEKAAVAGRGGGHWLDYYDSIMIRRAEK